MAVTLNACWVQDSAYEYGYTKTAQTLEHPCSGYYKVELWGAQGGGQVDAPTRAGGKGGYVSGTTYISASDSLYVYVGGEGFQSTAPTDYPDNYRVVAPYNQTYYAQKVRDSGFIYNGGGATDIRPIYSAWGNTDSLRSRIIVAGAGGGGEAYHWPAIGGNAGGLIGYNGASKDGVSIATGATQTSGGLNGNGTIYNGFGIVLAGGGEASTSENGGGTASGGTGWYSGGTGPHKDNLVGSGAGGSSYISGHPGSIAVTSASDTTPKCLEGSTSIACSESWAGYTFTDTTMIDGSGYAWTTIKGDLQAMPNPAGGYYASGEGHSGNGYAKILYLGPTI